MRHARRALASLLILANVILASCNHIVLAPPATPTPVPLVSPTSRPAAPTPTPPLPTVDNGATLKEQFKGKAIGLIYYGDSARVGHELDLRLATIFTQATGITVTVKQRPQAEHETRQLYQGLFLAQSPEIDVMMLDVIHTGYFAAHLADLGPKLATAARAHYEAIVQNNTVDGKLVAMPWFGDFGMLYYRTDLLQKYGFNTPPETWNDLEQQAKTIQDGERAHNSSFWGFVWQGAAYEGLTCNALEWIFSHGGRTIIEQDPSSPAYGKVTVNNQQAWDALGRAAKWIGNISPREVVTYREEQTIDAFTTGNAAFMRNWPYAYAASNQESSPIKGKFDAAPLPAEPGEKHSGTIGGQQLGVSKCSRNPDAATEFVRYMTSAKVQQYRAIVGSWVPTIKALADDPQVITARPFLPKFMTVERITRPAAPTGELYSRISEDFYKGVHQILQGGNAARVMTQVENRINRQLP